MKTKKTALTGLLVALAMILSYVESMLPQFVPIPGVKLGLTNIVVVVALICMGAGYAFSINIVRIVLVGLTFGGAFSMIYSLAGGIVSFAVMFLMWRSGRFGTVGISVAGGVAHNAAQIAVAAVLLETGKLIFYLPVLCISGITAGALIGMLGGITAGYLNRTDIF